MLEPSQVELDGLVMGPGTDYIISDLRLGGRGEIRDNDAPMPREDGIRFGRDHVGGATIEFEISVNTYDRTAASAAWAALASRIDARAVRTTPGAVSSLSVRIGDGETYRVFGRPRRFDPVATALADAGRVDLVGDFQCVDSYVYSDVEYQTMLGIVPESTGGLIGPLIGPLVAAADVEGDLSVTIEGTEPAWLVVRINGPIAYPTVEVADQWSVTLNIELASDQSVTLDPTPWNRSVRRDSDGANLAGTFTAASQRLSGMRILPGRRRVILRGTDPTGTASMTLFWRSTWLSF